MSLLGDRIKKERENLNLTREDLAKKLDVSYSAIAMYEQGNREPNNELIKKMCELFGCSLDYLIGETNCRTVNELVEKYLKEQFEVDVDNSFNRTHIFFLAGNINNSYKDKIKEILLSNNSFEVKKENLNNLINSFSGKKKKMMKAIVDSVLDYIDVEEENRRNYHYAMDMKKNWNTSVKYYKCPVYGCISAGQPNWADECIEGYLPIDPELMRITSPEECFFLRVSGESMNKKVKNGAYALIRKTDFVENGEIAVVLVNGNEATLKKFTKQGDLIILEPMSTDTSFTTQVYNKDTQIRVIGKYIGKMEME